MLVDSHCHLDFPDFASELDAVVTRAREAGLGRLVTISTRVRRVAGVLAIAERFPDVYCSVGTHPHYAHEELDVTVDDLVAHARHPKVVAIGEAGLDYHYDNSPRDAQERGFRYPYCSGACDRPAAGHSLARSRRRHSADSGGRNRAGRLPGSAPLLYRRRRPRSPRRCARRLRLLQRHPDLQKFDRAACDRGRVAGGSHSCRNRRALSRAQSIPR